MYSYYDEYLTEFQLLWQYTRIPIDTHTIYLDWCINEFITEIGCWEKFILIRWDVEFSMWNFYISSVMNIFVLSVGYLYFIRILIAVCITVLLGHIIWIISNCPQPLVFVNLNSRHSLSLLFLLQIKKYITPLEIMASLIAAVSHDLDHPGVNQPFLIATSNHLAALYQVVLPTYFSNFLRFNGKTRCEKFQITKPGKKKSI